MLKLYNKIDVRRDGLYTILCLMVLAAGVFKIDTSFQNAKLIFILELLFISLYILLQKTNLSAKSIINNNKYMTFVLILLYTALSFYCYLFNILGIYTIIVLTLIIYSILLKSGEPFVELIRCNRLVAALLLLWLISISISYFWSPLGVSETALGRVRYRQTIMHVFFFIVLNDYLSRYRPPLIYLLMVIPLSAILIGLAFLYIYFITPNGEIGDYQWFYNPPFQDHIRHVGYQVAAGIAALLPYILYRRGISPLMLSWYIAVIFLWAFLFWCGGRAAIMSILFVIILLWAVLMRFDKSSGKRFGIAVTVSVCVALALSYWVSVFSWNGVFQGISRSIDAINIEEISNVKQVSNAEAINLSLLTTGRSRIWGGALNSVRDHLVFGLGPQSYLYVKVFMASVHPHNMLIQFLLEWGLVGSLFFLVLIVGAFKSGVKRHILDTREKLNPDMLASVSIIVSLTIHGFVSGTYYHPQPSLYLAIAFAIWVLPEKIAPTSKGEVKDKQAVL